MADGKLQKWHKGKGQTVKWAKPVGLRILFLGDHGLGRGGQMNGTQRGEFVGQGTGQVFVAEGVRYGQGHHREDS